MSPQTNHFLKHVEPATLQALLYFSSLALTGLELPTRNKPEPEPEPEPTKTYDWLLEFLDRLGDPAPTLTTPAPSRPTTQPSSNSRRKGHRQKANPRTNNVPELPNGAVRLVGDEYGRGDRGRVEIYINGNWGIVCDDLWSIKNADVVCRQLGFSHALKATINSQFGEGRGLHILLDDVQCKGKELDLLRCSHAGIGKHNCAHSEAAGVICGNPHPVVEV